VGRASDSGPLEVDTCPFERKTLRAIDPKNPQGLPDAFVAPNSRVVQRDATYLGTNQLPTKLPLFIASALDRSIFALDDRTHPVGGNFGLSVRGH
jgi:hypothetical protein